MSKQTLAPGLTVKGGMNKTVTQTETTAMGVEVETRLIEDPDYEVWVRKSGKKMCLFAMEI